MKRTLALICSALILAGCGEGAAPEAVETQTVSGKFQVPVRDWIEIIPDTRRDMCDGDPDDPDTQCIASECYGVGPVEGLHSGGKVIVTNAHGVKVAMGEVVGTQGYKYKRRANCTMSWEVDVPAIETGVLTVTFGGHEDTATDFTLEKMRELPHNLDFMTIGRVD